MLQHLPHYPQLMANGHGHEMILSLDSLKYQMGKRQSSNHKAMID